VDIIRVQKRKRQIIKWGILVNNKIVTPANFSGLEKSPTGIDGIAATRKIRELWPGNDPKIIAITAYALRGERERCLDAGMDDYIPKPVRKGDLAEMLEKLISLRCL
jgi:CheY-like chemotaxis protein